MPPAAMPLPPGTKASDFALRASPGDWSPVCSDQLALYEELLPEFERFDAQPIGISVDGVWSHLAFAEDRNLHFPLLANFEPKGEVAGADRVLPGGGRHERVGYVRHRRVTAEAYAGDPDRSVWHRAAALTGPDERIVGELQAAAERDPSEAYNLCLAAGGADEVESVASATPPTDWLERLRLVT
jgi:hypothetical protein